MATNRRIEKKISYRLNIPAGEHEAALMAAADHWSGFQWESGRFIAEWVSQQHGNIQVWGVSHDEAQGVVRHALAHMGIEETEGDWLLTESTNPRFGKVATVQATVAAVRDGSNGHAPFVVMLGD